jgi:hypothetical protein
LARAARSLTRTPDPLAYGLFHFFVSSEIACLRLPKTILDLLDLPPSRSTYSRIASVTRKDRLRSVFCTLVERFLQFGIQAKGKDFCIGELGTLTEYRRIQKQN